MTDTDEMNVRRLSQRLPQFRARWERIVLELLDLHAEYASLLKNLTPEQKKTQAGEWLQEIVDLDLCDVENCRAPESIDDVLVGED